MRVRIYRPKREGKMLYHGGHPDWPVEEWRVVTVDNDDSCCAFSRVNATDEFFLVKWPPPGISFLDVMNHEHLHLTLNLIGENRASHFLDRISNHDDWREHGAIGGL